MTIKYLLGALALSVSSAALAADPAPAPKKESCCKTDDQGKMACCKDKAEQSGDEHKGHGIGAMDHK